jgi:hypothetical protein
MLGDVPRYAGELTPVIIQAFAREHGAEKPKATATDPGFYQLESDVPLPMHLAENSYLELSADEWRDLMQSTGYIVPEKKERRASSKPAPASLINPTAEQAEQLQRIWNLQMVAECKAKGRASLAESNTVKELTQAAYSANSGGSYSPLETIEIDAQGQRITSRRSNFTGRYEQPVPVARIRIYTGGAGFHKPRAVVHISDKPAKTFSQEELEAELGKRLAKAERKAARDRDRAVAEALSKVPKAAPVVPEAPKPEQFQTTEEYVKAVAKHAIIEDKASVPAA